MGRRTLHYGALDVLPVHSNAPANFRQTALPGQTTPMVSASRSVLIRSRASQAVYNAISGWMT